MSSNGDELLSKNVRSHQLIRLHSRRDESEHTDCVESALPDGHDGVGLGASLGETTSPEGEASQGRKDCLLVNEVLPPGERYQSQRDGQSEPVTGECWHDILNTHNHQNTIKIIS